MITDVIHPSDDGFTCCNCKQEFGPGTLVNFFRWGDRISLYCMKCLEEMGLDPDIQWIEEQERINTMKGKI